MICVLVKTKSDYWVTRINATLEEARKYFIGRSFEQSDETMGDPVISVELVETGAPFASV